MDVVGNDRPDATTVARTMRVWRQAHPGATLSEIECELDRQLRVVRAELLAEVAVAGADELATCPSCGTTLSRRGAHERTLVTDGDEALTLSRSYATCPACGGGLFPPG